MIDWNVRFFGAKQTYGTIKQDFPGPSFPLSGHSGE